MNKQSRNTMLHKVDQLKSEFNQKIDEEETRREQRNKVINSLLEDTCQRVEQSMRRATLF